MRVQRWLIVAAMTGAVVVGVQMVGAQQGDDRPAMSEAQRRSYAIGFLLRHRLAEQGIDVDERAFLQGFLAVESDEPPALSPEEMEAALRDLLSERRAEGDGTRRGSGRPYSTQSRGMQPAEVQGATPPGVNLRIDARLPSQRVDTALPTTRENTRRANDDDD